MPKDRLHVLAGRYQLQGLLGEGGMGLVWRAWDERLHQSVAIKEVSLSVGLSAQDREQRLRRTLREARTAATLRGHPGIVTIYDVVEEDGLPWIVMELIEGSSMAEVIKAEQRLSEARVAEIGLQVISALIAAEKAGIVHRDIKPANILLKGNRAVLTDFGISAAVHDTTDLTGSGSLLGTVPYLAPERIEGTRASAASDLWAVGVTLYEAVESRRPFDREGWAATMAAIVHQSPAPTRHVNRLRPVIDGLLTKNPAERLTADQAMALLAPVSAGAGREHPNGERGPENPEATGSRRKEPIGHAGSGNVDPVPLPVHVPTDGSRRSRTRAALAAGSVLATVVTVAMIWVIQSDFFGPSAAPTLGPTGSSAASIVQTTAPTGSPTPSTVQTPGPGGSPASSAAQTALPPGFSLHRDPRGFSLAVPDGWVEENDEDETQVSWKRPGASISSPSSGTLGAYGEPTKKETRKPAEILDQVRDALRAGDFTPNSYRELKRGPISFIGGQAAELEFTFAHKDAPSAFFRFYSRCIVRGSGGVGMFWFFAPAAEWSEVRTHVDTFARTFRLN